MTVRSSMMVPFLLALMVSCANDQGFQSHDDVQQPQDDDDDVVTGDPETEEASEEWVVTGAAKTDIMFFADTSGSMSIELQSLGAKASYFVNRLSAANVDWQIAAITGIDGCARNGVLRPTTAGYLTLFSTGVLMKPADEARDEWGLASLQVALNNSVPGGCNEGFMRPDANLHMIVLSDENDESRGFDTDPNYWRDYVDSIIGMKGDGSRVKFSAIAGDVPDGCTGSGAQAEPGWGYSEAVDATEGEFLSICSNWEDEIEVLADASYRQTVFQLANRPHSSSIEVFVEDVQVSSATWEYRPGPNQIAFLSDAPLIDEKVRVDYTIDPDA